MRPFEVEGNLATWILRFEQVVHRCLFLPHGTKYKAARRIWKEAILRPLLLMAELICRIDGKNV